MNFKLLLLALPCLASAAPMLQLEVEGSLDDFRKLDVQTIHESANAKVMEFMERDLSVSQECLNTTQALMGDSTLMTITEELMSTWTTPEQVQQVCSQSGNTMTCSFLSSPKQAEFSTQCVALGGVATTYGMIWTITAEGQTAKMIFHGIPLCVASACHDTKELIEELNDQLKEATGGELLGFDIEIIASSASDKVVKGLTAALGLVLAGFTLWN
jgi:hypothetical protein